MASPVLSILIQLVGTEWLIQDLSKICQQFKRLNYLTLSCNHMSQVSIFNAFYSLEILIEYRFEENEAYFLSYRSMFGSIIAPVKPKINA